MDDVNSGGRKEGDMAFQDDFRSQQERDAAERAELYETHKNRGSLGTYYEMFDDERPRPFEYWPEHMKGGRSR